MHANNSILEYPSHPINKRIGILECTHKWWVSSGNSLDHKRIQASPQLVHKNVLFTSTMSGPYNSFLHIKHNTHTIPFSEILGKKIRRGHKPQQFHCNKLVSKINHNAQCESNSGPWSRETYTHHINSLLCCQHYLRCIIQIISYAGFIEVSMIWYMMSSYKWKRHTMDRASFYTKYRIWIYDVIGSGYLTYIKMCRYHRMRWLLLVPIEKIDLAYLSSKKSIIKVDGFPTTIGSFWVDPHTAATMHPAPKMPKAIT